MKLIFKSALKRKLILVRRSLLLILSILFCVTTVYSQTFEAEKAVLNPKRMTIISQKSFSGEKGVVVKENEKENKEQKATSPSDEKVMTEPDLVFKVNIKEAATYQLRVCAGVDPEKSEEILRNTKNKFASFFAKLQIGDGNISSRVVFSPWRNPLGYVESWGLFDLPEGTTEIKIDLPDQVRLDYIKLNKWTPPAIPEKAVGWTPEIVPPKGHPRLWTRPELLPELKKKLLLEENMPVWKLVQKDAQKPLTKKPPLDIIDNKSVADLSRFLQIIQKKAFYYLITKDEKIGQEAVKETVALIRDIQFGNYMDVTRERGFTIYSAALVYDWCFSLLTEEEKKIIEKNMLLSAREMEIGWPPFRQIIVNGHGNEAQLLRDFLAMGIAIYDADPEPYRLCAYRIFEELVPMRKFEYQSSRHNQGISYASFRFTWELTAATLIERMTGKRVFDENINNLADYFLNMRLPDGQMFNDADNWGMGLFRYPKAALMMYAYGKNPLMKAEYFRHKGGKPETACSVLFLLMNDPELKPDYSFQSLPLGFESKPVFSSHIVRTGWMKENWMKEGNSVDPDSNEVIVEMRGGSFSSSGHQHEDAGAFQILYRGKQTCDLGIYGFYGTPYDVNFNKRSSSHNLVFVFDPDEKFPGNLVNDAGQRKINRTPLTPADYLENPLFRTARILRSKFYPSAEKPVRSEYTLDLTPAYSEKVDSYIRSFRWLNLKRKDVPAVLIVYDKLTIRDSAGRDEAVRIKELKQTNSSNKRKSGKSTDVSHTAKSVKGNFFKTFWQINTLNKPELTEDGFISSAPLPENAKIAPGRMALTVLLPEKKQRSVEIIGGEQASDILEHHFKAPPKKQPEEQGWRTHFAYKNNSAKIHYLNVIQLLGENSEKLPVKFEKKNGKYYVEIDGKTECFDE